MVIRVNKQHFFFFVLILLTALALGAFSALAQSYPSTSFGETSWLVVWHGGHDGNQHVYGARISQTGAVLDPSGIMVLDGGYHAYPAVAFDGRNWLVVASKYDGDSIGRHICAARVDQAGNVLDPEGIDISETGYLGPPSVAFGEHNYLVVWEVIQYSGGQGDIYASRVSPEGDVLDPGGIPISTAEGNQMSPSVAFDGTNWLVVWRDSRNEPGYDGDIYAARVTQSGEVLDLEGDPICTAANAQSDPTLAFGDENYFVAWTDRRSGYSRAYGARVSPSNTVLDTDGIDLVTAGLVGQNPEVAFGRTQWLVVASQPQEAFYPWHVVGAIVDSSASLQALSDVIGVGNVTSAGFGKSSWLVTLMYYEYEQPANIRGGLVSEQGEVLSSFCITCLTANAGPDQTFSDSDGDGSEEVKLDASSCTYPSGNITKYTWMERGVQIAIGETPTVTLSVGMHTITLIVTGNDGTTGTDNVVVTVEASGGTVTGRVTNASTGEGIAGATVEAEGPVVGPLSMKGKTSPSQAGAPYSTSTDANGDYTLHLPEGTYDMTASAEGYELGMGGATVTAGETTTVNFSLAHTADTTPPALIQNFIVSNGEDRKCTLQWNNPSDTDLAKVVVRRRTDKYPTAHNDGDEVKQYTSATPEELLKYVDAGLTNGTTYYYAVFSCDTASNWNDQVVEGKNADTGKPGLENQPPETEIINASISGNTANFSWSGSDDTTPATQLTYSYRIVRPGPAYDNWSSWSSGKTKKYTNLSPGNYKFQVRARDAQKLIDPSPASKEFAIEETGNHSPIAHASDISGQPQMMYPDTSYTVTAKYFDPDGRDDLKICYLQLKHPEKRLTMMWYQEDGHTSTYAGEEGANYITKVEATATAITDADGTEGYEIKWTFEINDKWPEVENTIDFGVFASDGAGLESGWDYDNTDATFRVFEIGVGNRPPIAVIRHYPSDMFELFRLVFLLLGHSPYYDRGQEIVFDAMWSVDPDGTITAYEWNFGDGYGASGNVVRHVYTQRGEYKVRLAVTDNEGETNEFTETVFIAIPSQAELGNLRDAADHLLTTAEKLLEYTLVPASESTAEAAHEYLTLMSEDAIDALYTFLTAFVPGPKIGAGDGFWKILLRQYGHSAAMESGRFVAKKPFVDFMHALKAADVPYASILAHIRDAVLEAKSSMSASRSGLFEGLEDLDAADVRDYENDLRLRAVGNLFMANLYYATAQALHSTAEIERRDRDSWTLFAGKICWGVGITAGVAAGTAAFGPIFGKVAGFSSFGLSMYDSLQSLEVNARYCVTSQYALRRGGTEDSIEFPINVLAAIRENVMQGFRYLRDRKAPMTIEGQILSIDKESGNDIRVRIKNTGDHAGRFRLILQTETRFTSYELFRGAGRYYIVPYVAHYPKDELGWDLLPGQEMTVEVELPKFAVRAYINLLGESESGIYGLDSMSMVYRQEARSWVGRAWNRIRLQWGSPIEVLVKAADGNTTGVVRGSVMHNIPNSYCDLDKETIWLLSPASPSDPFSKLRILISGIGEGSYDLKIERSGISGTDVFTAVDVPVHLSVTHNYSVDWDALARGEHGVTLQIDINGDGMYDETLFVGPNLDGGDIQPIQPIPVRKTKLSIGPNPVTDTGTTFFYALPEGTSTAKLMVFNVSGQPVFETSLEVTSIRFPSAGTWNPVDQDDVPLANGPYIYVLIADGKVIGQGKMVIQR